MFDSLPVWIEPENDADDESVIMQLGAETEKTPTSLNWSAFNRVTRGIERKPHLT